MTLAAESNRPLEGTATLESVIRYAFKKLHEQVEGMLPAIVVSYDRAANMVGVRPTVPIVLSDGTTSQRPVFNVPCLALGGGGYCISWPIQIGDLGWIFASDRDTAAFLKGLTAAAPGDDLRHTFSRGMFIPDEFRKYTLASPAAGSPGGLSIQSLDGTMSVVLNNGTVTITAPTSVVINSPTTTVQHDLVVQGSTTLQKTSVQGVDIYTHVHDAGTYNISGTPVTGHAGEPIHN